MPTLFDSLRVGDLEVSNRIYSPGEHGYTDYPTLEGAASAMVLRDKQRRVK